LVNAYLHEGKIDHDVYQDQLARLREEQTLAEMELNEARVDEPDIETVVNFANAIGDASRFWIEASLEQKQRFPSALFPKGLAFDGERFGTAPTCLAFSYLREVSRPNSSLASRTGVEPRLVGVTTVKETRFTVIQKNFAEWIALYRTSRTHRNC
jgi:hypothetical protein